jgi:hypothetical protein
MKSRLFSVIRFYLIYGTIFHPSLNSSLSSTTAKIIPSRFVLSRTVIFRLRGGSDWEEFKQNLIEEENAMRYILILMIIGPLRRFRVHLTVPHQTVLHLTESQFLLNFSIS